MTKYYAVEITEGVKSCVKGCAQWQMPCSHKKVADTLSEIRFYEKLGSAKAWRTQQRELHQRIGVRNPTIKLYSFDRDDLTEVFDDLDPVAKIEAEQVQAESKMLKWGQRADAAAKATIPVPKKTRARKKTV